MANLTKSADELIAEVAASVKQDLLTMIQPMTRQIVEAVAQLQKALGATQAPAAAKAVAPAVPARRPGRPAGKKNAKAVKAAAAKVVSAPKPAAAPKKAAGTQKRSPRGALQASILATLAKSGSPMKLTAMCNEILKTPEFKGRQPKTLYTQIVLAIKKMPNVVKTASGGYQKK